MSDNLSNLQNLSQDLSELIRRRKEDYNSHRANKLSNPQSSPKTFLENPPKLLQWEQGTINTFNYSQ